MNTISPGLVETPIFGKIGLPAAEASEFAKSMINTVALKRLGQSDEIARVAVFLASEDSSFLVGTEIVADGGMAEL